MVEMEEIYDRVNINPLFKGIKREEFSGILKCLMGRVRNYKRDEFIFLSGDRIQEVGIIIEGSLIIITEDLDGNKTITTELSCGDCFGEVFACAMVDLCPVSVMAKEDSRILFINYKKIISTCSSSCAFHTRLIENMLRLIANKNLVLTSKLSILSKRTIRERILLYLELESKNRPRFLIPFNREELANYLCVDRSALSKELCKLRDEGIIRFKKNEFEIFYL